LLLALNTSSRANRCEKVGPSSSLSLLDRFRTIMAGEDSGANNRFCSQPNVYENGYLATLLTGFWHSDGTSSIQREIEQRAGTRQDVHILGLSF